MIESRLTAAGSTSGIVAERMKLGMATRSGYEGDGADRTRRELTWLLGLTRDLTDIEQRVYRTHYGSTAGSVGYEDLRRVGDLAEGDGEDVIDVRPNDPAGQPLGGEWVRVRGVRARYPSWEETGRALGLTTRQVQRHLEEARAKVQTAIAWRLMMAEQESRYE